MPTGSQSFDLILNVLPAEMLPREVRPRLKHLFDELDGLLFLDDTHELAIDRDTLIRIISNEDLMPATHRDVALLETSKYLGRRVKKFRKGQRITWQDGAKFGLPIKPPSKSELRELGITKTASIADLNLALKKAFPEVPKFWSKVNPETFLRAFLENRTVWDCLVANLGYFAAILIVGTLIIGAMLLANGVPWQVILTILIIYSGALTAYFILQCLANTEFHQF